MADTTSRPSSISLPSPPPLTPSRTPDRSSPPPTNTYALLLPLPALFAPRSLELLHTFYARFGPLRHWAPVRGLGRVIVVWERERDARRAKEEGGDRVEVVLREGEEGDGDGKGYFAGAEAGNQVDKPKSIILRIHPLPFTPPTPPASETHLSLPSNPRNHLISPPGSPPEGWEPVVEDPPNAQSLAVDLQRALEALVLQRGDGGGDDEEGQVILQTDTGFSVRVEDTARGEPLVGEDPSGDAPGAGGISSVKATASAMGGHAPGGHDECLERDGRSGAGWRTPGLGEGTFRILPTARPPV